MEPASVGNIDEANRRVVILANRKAGRGGKSAELVQSFFDQLNQAGLKAELHEFNALWILKRNN